MMEDNNTIINRCLVVNILGGNMGKLRYVILCCFIALFFSGCKQEEVVVKDTLELASDKVIHALGEQDMDTLSAMVHPEKGVRFTPYSYINEETDRKVSAEDIKIIFDDTATYSFGTYDGSGEPISYTWKEYYNEFVYSKDFINAESISYNKLLHKGNMIDNIKDIYPESEYVEYYFSGFDETYGGADWQALTLVFEKYENKYYVVGIIHNQWTV